MTSHELRNPLSAVVQSECSSVTNGKSFTLLTTTGADVVLESLHQISAHAKNMLGCTPTQQQKHFARLKSEIESGLESIHTIESCSVHQKRIIEYVSLCISPCHANISQRHTNTVQARRKIVNHSACYSSLRGINKSMHKNVSLCSTRTSDRACFRDRRVNTRTGGRLGADRCQQSQPSPHQSSHQVRQPSDL